MIDPSILLHQNLRNILSVLIIRRLPNLISILPEHQTSAPLPILQHQPPSKEINPKIGDRNLSLEIAQETESVLDPGRVKDDGERSDAGTVDGDDVSETHAADKVPVVLVSYFQGTGEAGAPGLDDFGEGEGEGFVG
ncbi:hypothetical protein ABW19_dt0202278 [Dactylella cylindrospora]|nr:hypothetical protein ABW19_dt0202278 [Dactylella cylindrospora]